MTLKDKIIEILKHEYEGSDKYHTSVADEILKVIDEDSMDIAFQDMVNQVYKE
jgi:putative N-acetylmannosamine-6-phosphate epimerase